MSENNRGPIRVVHFLNQFFAGIGSEESANHPIEVREGPVGPGNAFVKAFDGAAEIVATIVAGDNYFNEESELSRRMVVDTLARYRPDLVIAGPAFNSGRYGLSCAEVCYLAYEDGIPAVTSMFPENPGTLTHRPEVVIVPTTEAASGMNAAVETVARIGLKLASGQELGPASEEGYLGRGIRKIGTRDKRAADRAVDMILAKIEGEPFETELPIELPNQIEPAHPIGDLTKARVALVTAGGLVPMGNPDRLPGGPAQVWLKYEIGSLQSMEAGKWESVHVGFFTDITNRNPNYVLPLNIMRTLEDRGVIESIHHEYFSTSGRGTTVADSERMGKEMAADLKKEGVDAVVMVAT
jgi:betaine reductase